MRGPAFVIWGTGLEEYNSSMQQISSCVALQLVDDSNERALYLMPTHLTLAYVIDGSGRPSRIRAESHVEVPLTAWASPEAEDDAILQVMVRNAAEFTLLAPTLGSIDRGFWAQIQRNTRALVMHPSLEGSFFVPEHSQVFLAPSLVLNLVICIGPAARAGTVLCRGNHRGYILPVQDGVMSVRIGGPDNQ